MKNNVILRTKSKKKLAHEHCIRVNSHIHLSQKEEIHLK